MVYALDDWWLAREWLLLPGTFVLVLGVVMSDDGLIGVSAAMGAGRWGAVAT